MRWCYLGGARNGCLLGGEAGTVLKPLKMVFNEGKGL